MAVTSVDEVRGGSIAPFAGAANPLATRARSRRRARAAEGKGGLSTALPATFLGLLLVQALRPTDAFAAAEAGRPGTMPAGEAGGTSGVASGPASAAALPAGAAAIAGVAAGSVLLSGSLIDSSALTRLSGEGARWGDLPVRADALGEAGSVVALGGQPAVVVTPAEVTLATGTIPELPSLAVADVAVGDPDEDLGPIGDFDSDGAGDGALVGTEANDVLLGGGGADVLRGLGGDDRLEGGDGDDRLEGGAGRDALLGGAGADRLDGGDDRDRLEGGDGDDLLTGGAGEDALLGDAGNDRLDGGGGRDVMQGGTGNDTYVVDDLTDLALETPDGADGGGSDTLVVADGFAGSVAEALPLRSADGRTAFAIGQQDGASFPGDLAGYRHQVQPDIEHVWLEGAAAHDVVGDARSNLIGGNDGANRLYGGGGNDTLAGGGGEDRLDGGIGADRLDGGLGDDLLYGGAGDDWLDGGEGDDWLAGGAGDDTFLLGLAEDGATVFDHEGRNTLRLEGGGADALSRLEASFGAGGDLELAYDGVTVATLDGWADHRDSFAGIDLGDGAGIRPLEGLLPEGGGGDWLADFLAEGAPSAAAWRGVAVAQAEMAGGPAEASWDAAVPAVPWLAGPLDHGFTPETGEVPEPAGEAERKEG